MSTPAKRPVLVSACLLGRNCRYDGKHSESTELLREIEGRGERPVPYCPEEAGGLGTPRPRAWLEAPAQEVLRGTGGVVTEHGEDVSEAFRAGAEGAVELAAREGISRAYLKERSPSCGVCTTHVDGSPVAGPGLTAACLARVGIDVHGR